MPYAGWLPIARPTRRRQRRRGSPVPQISAMAELRNNSGAGLSDPPAAVSLLAKSKTGRLPSLRER
jgi:hypothetical protein